MATYALSIAAPRSDRWYQLEEVAWGRDNLAATDYSEPRRLAATGRNCEAVLGCLRALGRQAPTKEIAHRLSLNYTVTLTALRLLRADGEISRTQSSTAGRTRTLWGLR